MRDGRDIMCNWCGCLLNDEQIYYPDGDYNKHCCHHCFGMLFMKEPEDIQL